MIQINQTVEGIQGLCRNGKYIIGSKSLRDEATEINEQSDKYKQIFFKKQDNEALYSP